MTRILGIDPGLQSTGYGLVNMVGERCEYIDSGCIRSSGTDLPLRLGRILTGLNELLAAGQPQQLAIEQVFVHRSPTSALKLGQARGVAIAAAAMAQVPVFEYAPRQIKQALTGLGGANKAQVMHMVQALLGIQDMSLAEDASDALAVAICHAHSCTSALHHAGARRGRHRRWRRTASPGAGKHL